MSNMCFLHMLGILPDEVQNLLLKPDRVFMLLMVCRGLRSIIRREGHAAHLKMQVTVRPKRMFPAGEGLREQLQTVEHLQISSLQLAGRGLRGINDHIYGIAFENRWLRSVDLRDNTLSYSDLYFTAMFLSHHCPLLDRLSIGQNSEDDWALDSAMEIVCGRLPKLRYLDASMMNIGRHGFRRTSELLATATLTELNLAGNHFLNEHVVGILKALTNNTTLTSLNLSGNSFGEKGAKALETMVAVNTTITDLRISSIGAPRDNIVHVLYAIRMKNTTLMRLDISDNLLHYSEETPADLELWLRWGIPALIQAKTPLRHLDISGCQIPASTAERIVEAASGNTTLTSLVMD